MLRFEDNRILVTNIKERISFNNNRILVVDDNEAIHKDLKKILALTSSNQKKDEYDSLKEDLFGDDEDFTSDFQPETLQGNNTYDYEVDSAFQGQEAFQMLEKSYQDGRPYAMIFMDVRMPPGWDGIETISRIWEKYPDVEIAVCSAYSDYPWENIIAKLGPTDKLLFLEKPFSSIEVQQMALALVKKWNLRQEANHYMENLEQIVSKRTKQLETLLNSLKLSIVVTEYDGEIIFCNPLARDFLENEKIIGEDIRTVMEHFPEIKEQFLEMYRNKEKLPVDFYAEKANLMYKFTLMQLEEENIIKPSLLFLIEDVTDWHKRVNTDGLTGIWSQRYFKEVLDKEIKKSQRYKTPLSLIMMDVDHFKKFNDTYGHQTGDIILKAISQILKNLARETDVVARYGGEEFGAILPMTDEEGAKVFAGRINREIEKMELKDVAGNLIPPVTVSVGISNFNEGSMVSFLESADKALYTCKNRGRNCIISYSSITDEL